MKTDEIFVNIDDLPNVLSEQELYNLFLEFKNGDINAREKIVEHNIKLVLFLVNKKYNSSIYDKKELVATGSIGLLKAVDTFEINKNTKFSTYALKCINNEILMLLRKEKNNYNINSIDDSFLYYSNGESNKISDLISDDVDIVHDYITKETYSFIRNLVNNLPDRNREILMMYFGFYDDVLYSQKEIAKKFNFTQSFVSKIISKSLFLIKKELETNEYIDKKTKKLLK